MSITRIVITGGPCAGKTTGMSWIQNAFSAKGYTVLFVPETATELISGGVAPWTCGTNLDYQKGQMRLQLVKEQIFTEAARTMPKEKLLIVCDRGALDNRAYMNDEEYAAVLAHVGRTHLELRDGYDAVFHLVTAAKGAAEFYTTANNSARIETVEQAIALDEKLLAAWTGHPHLGIIDNARDFESKMRSLISGIAAFLGEPEAYEVKRRFLIEYPDLDALRALPGCSRVEIAQTYLRAGADEIRVRRRGVNGSYLYYENRKRERAGGRYIQTERRLSEEEYLERLEDADPTRHEIRKDRYCFAEDSRYYEIDVYPFWKDRAIAQLRLTDPTDEPRFPSLLKPIREVTDDPEYKNAYLATL